MRLSTRSHERDAAGFVHVYPVLSRRSGGVSVGVNLNPNNACNWRCIYCQVPDLVRGAAPPLDLDLLEGELRTFLADVVRGDWMRANVPAGSRRLNDVAISGNGEATTSRQFDQVIERLCRVLDDFELTGRIKLVLITNGSLVQRPEVARGLARMARANGEVWFKLDRATAAGRALWNDVRLSDERVQANLRSCAAACRTRIQTIVMALDGEPPAEADQAAYVDFLARQVADGVPLADVLLYGLERTPHQPEAARLSKLPAEWLERYAERIRAGTGLAVEVHP